jgi:hypothetical protein
MVKFKPIIKKPGDLILSEDWNTIQRDVSDDLKSLETMINAISKKGFLIVASGVASHGLYVKLNWDVKPSVILSLSGTLKDVVPAGTFRCFPYNISPDGFSIYALSDTGEEGIVNWLAIGVKGGD